MKIYNNNFNHILDDVTAELMSSKFRYDWNNNIFVLDNIKSNPNVKYMMEMICNTVSNTNIKKSFVLARSYGQEYIHRIDDDTTRVICSPYGAKWMINWGGHITFHNNDKKQFDDTYASNSEAIKYISDIDNSIILFDSDIICYEHFLSKYFPFLKFTIVIDFVK